MTKNSKGEGTASASPGANAVPQDSEDDKETAAPPATEPAPQEAKHAEALCDDTEDQFPLKDVVTGNLDKRGRLILDVLWAVSEFKIFKTDKGISPHFSDNKELAEEQRRQYLALGAELAEMNHLIHQLSQYNLRQRWSRFRSRSDATQSSTDGPPKSSDATRKTSEATRKSIEANENSADATQNYYERELARGIAQALTGQEEQGKATLAALAKRLEKRLRNKGRVVYFGMCLISTLVIIGPASIVLAVGKNDLSEAIGLDLSEMALAAIMGSLGALLSTAVGLRSLRIDASASWVMNLVYGFTRMLVGVLGAVVLYLAVRAGLALQLVPGIPADAMAVDSLDPYKLSFISVLAGFSERLVPNLLDREAAEDSEDSRSEDGKG